MDFISAYLKYVGKTESPVIYHRWACLSMLSAYLGRTIHFQFGHKTVYPNIFCVLMGSPGTRKSVPINISKDVLANAGFKDFSANKTTLEAFIEDLMPDTSEEFLESLDFSRKFVACDEFNNFIGYNNEAFISVLGELWDCPKEFKYSLRKAGKSVFLNNPYVTILGGNTPKNFRRAFPVELIDQGFFSRLMLIYSRPLGSEHKITFPVTPSEEARNAISGMLVKIGSMCSGEVSLSSEASKLLDSIYKEYKGVDDRRFSYYNSRRLEHLIKLSMLIAASNCTTDISREHVLYAHTILVQAEIYMPKALGEYGKSRVAESTNAVLDVIENSYMPISAASLWEELSSDITSLQEMMQVLRNLTEAKKINYVPECKGWLAVQPTANLGKHRFWDFNLLEEFKS